MEEEGLVRKLLQFIVCICGLAYALLWPADPSYKGFLFVEATLTGAGLIFLWIMVYRIAEFWYWIKDED